MAMIIMTIMKLFLLKEIYFWHLSVWFLCFRAILGSRAVADICRKLKEFPITSKLCCIQAFRLQFPSHAVFYVIESFRAIFFFYLLRIWQKISVHFQFVVVNFAQLLRSYNRTSNNILHEYLFSDMEFVQNFTPPDFQAKNFTPSISPNFNSFSKKKHKKWVKMEKFTPLAKILHCRRQWRHGQIPPLSFFSLRALIRDNNRIYGVFLKALNQLWEEGKTGDIW